MKIMPRLLVLTTAVFTLLAHPAATEPLKLKSLPSAPSPVPLIVLKVLSPGSGENLEIGRTYDITWSSSNVSGYLRLDLYRGGTDSQQKVGTITASTAVARGKYTWEAGKRLGLAPLAPGSDYRIVAEAYTPPLTRPSAPFNLVAATGKTLAPAVSSAKMKGLVATKQLSLTYPRRADGFHKGLQYKITWSSRNLNNAKLKVELLNNQETTVVQAIAENIENAGERLWDVPMSLPDEVTLYKIRIRTMDGAQQDTAGPIRISKLTAPTGAPSLKVTNPIMGDHFVGDTLPVKWTSTANCSSYADGPSADAFRIDLMNEHGTEKVMELTDIAQGFASEGPSGILNWHWDWKIELGGSYQSGTYSVKVSNYDGKCSDTSESFRIMYPRKRLEIKPQSFASTIFQLPGTVPRTLPQTLEWQLDRLGCTGNCYPVRNPIVGAHYGILVKYIGGGGLNEDPQRIEEFYGYVLRSRVDFHVFDKKPAGTIKQVRLRFDRTWQAAAPEISPCLRGFVIDESPWTAAAVFNGAPPPLSGTIPVNSAQGDTFDVVITQQYLDHVARTGGDAPQNRALP